jgi:RNA polymerase sigma-70 factor, ECF subfamily
MNMKQFSDEMLIEMLLNENQEAFEEIYDRYWFLLYSIAYRKIKSKEDAQELVQELFLKLLIRRSQLVIHSSVRAYLMSALKKSIINYIRAHTSQSVHLYNYQRQQLHQENPTESDVIVKELNKLIDENVALLPEHCQEIFILSRYQDLTHKEIADKMNISTKTVANQINKALRMLKLPLREYANLLLIVGFYGCLAIARYWLF